MIQDLFRFFPWANCPPWSPCVGRAISWQSSLLSWNIWIWRRQQLQRSKTAGVSIRVCSFQDLLEQAGSVRGMVGGQTQLHWLSHSQHLEGPVGEGNLEGKPSWRRGSRVGYFWRPWNLHHPQLVNFLPGKWKRYLALRSGNSFRSWMRV